MKWLVSENFIYFKFGLLILCMIFCHKMLLSEVKTSKIIPWLNSTICFATKKIKNNRRNKYLAVLFAKIFEEKNEKFLLFDC
jgi:hypothetical protein